MHKQHIEQTVHKLRKLKEDCHVVPFLDAVKGLKENSVHATLLLYQITKYEKKHPMRSEMTVRYSIILQNLSAKSYEYEGHATGVK